MKRVHTIIWIGLFLLLTSSFTGLRAQVIINEIVCSNASGLLDVTSGQFTDWIELHNLNDTEISLGGYFLSDDPDRPARWSVPDETQIPANGFILIYPDKTDTGLHTNFGLSKDGETLSLYDPNGILVDYLEFGEQKTDISYGRNPNNLLEWQYFGQPTPGKTNGNDGVLRPTLTEPPQPGITGGFFGGSVSLSVNSPTDPDTRVYYTTTGQVPTEESSLYTDEFIINKTTIIRFRAFTDGLLPSKVVTQTYFIGEESDLPVFSITTEPDYLWDEEIGIYVDGSNFNGERDSRNSCQKDWERPINIEFFDENQQGVFNVQAGLEIKGRMNCEFPKKPLGIYFRSKYGDDYIDYQFFPEKPFSQFFSFFLRPGGADGMGDCYNGTMIRDGLLSTILVDRMDIDYEAYRPAVLFINGQYWGVHNIRERNKEDYVANNHNVDPDNLDILENPANGGIIEGDDEHYREMLYYARSEVITTPEGLEGIKKRMDLQEFLNYQIAELFVNNEDWAHNNVQCWRPRTEEGIWRWIFYDVEGGFGLYGEDDYNNDLFNFNEDTFLKHAFLFESLMDNPVIRAMFLQGFAAHLNTTFKTERVIHLIDSLAGDIDAEMARDVVRWADHTTNGGSWCSPISSLDQWQDHLQILRDFATMRPQVIINQLIDHFQLNDLVQVNVQAEGGQIKIAGVENTSGGLYFRNVPLYVEAISKPGYQFVKWEGMGDHAEISIDLTQDTTLTAVFVHSGESVLPQIIDTKMQLKVADSPYTCAGDIIIEKDALLKIDPGVEIRMPAEASIYVYGVLQATGEKGQPIRIYPAGHQGKGWGSIVFDHAQPGSILEYVDLDTPTLGSRNAAKYKAALNIHQTLVPVFGLTIRNGYKNGIYVSGGEARLENCTLFIDQTGDYVNVADADQVVIESCQFNGNSAPDTDGIDLDRVLSALIRGNTFKNFKGSNSDGLDVGYSQEITIEKNVFSGISDKGISIGMGSSVRVFRNLFLSCHDGLGIKDKDSNVFGDRNTFFDNTTGVHCFEKEPGRGGGQAELINSLFAGLNQTPGWEDEFSSINFSYCWSESEKLSGTNNYQGKAGLLSPGTGIFRLGPTSACHDSGDPDSESDPDGTRADIGAHYFHKDQYPGVFLNELIHTPDGWIVEIYNKGESSVELSNLVMMVNDRYLRIPKLGDYTDQNNQINAKEFLTLSISDERLSLVPGDLLILAQSIVDEDVILSSLPVSNFMEQYSRGCFPDGTYQLRHFENQTPGWENAGALSGAGQLFINEVMANKGSIEDNNNDKSDWLELYNAGSESYFLGGLYLTDDMDDPTKHQLPASFKTGLTMESHGFSLFWADGNASAGFDHLNFKLNAEKEEVGIFRIMYPDTLLIDSLSFVNQEPDLSYGRYPDGSDELRQFVTPTPGLSNTILRIDSFTTNLNLTVYPNPCFDYLYVDLESKQDEQVELEIYNLTGQLMVKKDLFAKFDETIVIPMNQLEAGIYLVSVRLDQELKTARIFKK